MLWVSLPHRGILRILWGIVQDHTDRTRTSAFGNPTIETCSGTFV